MTLLLLHGIKTQILRLYKCLSKAPCVFHKICMTYCIDKKREHYCVYFKKKLCSTAMFIAALFTMSKRWKQPKYLSKGE